MGSPKLCHLFRQGRKGKIDLANRWLLGSGKVTKGDIMRYFAGFIVGILFVGFAFLFQKDIATFVANTKDAFLSSICPN